MGLRGGDGGLGGGGGCGLRVVFYPIRYARAAIEKEKLSCQP